MMNDTKEIEIKEIKRPFFVGLWLGIGVGNELLGLKEGGLVFSALPFPFMDE